MKQPKKITTWPVYLLALPAFVAIWSGWVGLGQLAGFGPMNLLPGIGKGFTIDTAITLPIGMETYAAYALRVWTSGRAPRAARSFARWTALSSLIVGSLGQIGYHLMAAAGWISAPWPVVILVSIVPVAVLGMGAGLVHLVRSEDDDESDQTADQVAEPSAPLVPVFVGRDEISDLVAEESPGPATTPELWERYATRVPVNPEQVGDPYDLVGLAPCPDCLSLDHYPHPTDQVDEPATLSPREVYDRMDRDRPESDLVDQVAARRRSDDELWHQFGDQLCREYLDADDEPRLTRYRVENVTGAARRQAERILSRVIDAVEQQPAEVTR